MRVVEHTDERLVVWVASGTELLRPVPIDGRDQRDRPLEERFTCDMRYALVPWYGAGTLRVASWGDAHSSWLFRRPDNALWGWYGNLEDPLTKTDDGVQTIDHVLDVWLDLTTGVVGWKDEDELEAAITVGRFSAEKAESIRAHGAKVFAAMERRDPPFDGEWLDWAPHADWDLPLLPDRYRALVGNPAPYPTAK